jgi:3-phenylpropionate/trans-cinnamate dioxygenase ferredoxin component
VVKYPDRKEEGPTRVEEFVKVGSLVEVQDGEVRGYDTRWGRVVVAHMGSRVFALKDECSEDGCALSEGFLDEEGEVVCPCDGSAFDAETGEPTRGPAVDPVTPFATRVEEGWIEVAAT